MIGVDEHMWRHTRRDGKYVTVIIDLTPVRKGTGPARLLDMVDGRSKQAFKTWLAQRWRPSHQHSGMPATWTTRPPPGDREQSVHVVFSHKRTLPSAGQRLCRHVIPNRATYAVPNVGDVIDHVSDCAVVDDDRRIGGCRHFPFFRLVALPACVLNCWRIVAGMRPRSATWWPFFLAHSRIAWVCSRLRAELLEVLVLTGCATGLCLIRPPVRRADGMNSAKTSRNASAWSGLRSIS